MIILDFTEQAIEAAIDNLIDPIAILVTGGSQDGEELVQFEGVSIPYGLANRVRATGRPDFIVRTRSLSEAGRYEVVSSYRSGHSRMFTLEFDLNEERLETRVTSSENTFWIFEDDSLTCGPNRPLSLTVPWANLSFNNQSE